MAGRRKSKYQTHVEPKLLLIEAWARDGMIQEDIAKKLGVAMSSFSDYKNKFPELSEALKRGQVVVDVEVENALFKKGAGLSGHINSRNLIWIVYCRPHQKIKVAYLTVFLIRLNNDELWNGQPSKLVAWVRFPSPAYEIFQQKPLRSKGFFVVYWMRATFLA